MARPIVGITTTSGSATGATGPSGQRRSRARVRRRPYTPITVVRVGSDHRNVVAQPVTPVGPRSGHITSETVNAIAKTSGIAAMPGCTAAGARTGATAGAARVTSPPPPVSRLRSVTARRMLSPNG